MLHDCQGIDRAERLHLLPQRVGLGTQRFIVNLHGVGHLQQLFQRTPPLGLQTLTDRTLVACQFGVLQFRLVQSFSQCRRLTTDLGQRMLGVRECFVRLEKLLFRGGQVRLSVLQARLTSLQLQLPRRHLLGQLVVRTRKRGELLLQRCHPLLGRGKLLRQATLTVLSHVKTCLPLCPGNLGGGACLTRTLVQRSCLLQFRATRTRPLLGARSVRLQLGAAFHERLHTLLEIGATLYESLHHRVCFRQFPPDALVAPLGLYAVLLRTAGVAMRSGSSVRSRRCCTIRGLQCRTQFIRLRCNQFAGTLRLV